MKIPKKLKIGAHTYKIQIVKDLDKCGSTDRMKETISLADWLPKSQLEATLIHEILHAINNEMDHERLDSLAEQLYQVFSDNKLLK